MYLEILGFTKKLARLSLG